LVDTAIVVDDTLGNRTYRFKNIATGKYMIKAVLSKNSQYYQIFFPTYYYTTLKWSNSDAIYMVNGYSDIKTANIYLKIGKNPGGPGFIGGKISAGANKKEGDPLKDIQVMLFNADKEPVTYTYSDADGNFKFENIAYDTYEVYTEVIGLKTNSAYVTISEEKPKVENVVVKVSESGISTSIRSNLSEDFIAQPKLYPNPVQNILYLETQFRKSQNTRLVIYNITGLEVYGENMSLQQGNQTHIIDTEKLPAGAYILMLKNALGESEMQAKFMKY
ncbi:MAG: T9SS type A sorting domain-containing protein, partial [Bacteroidia bacterium]